LGLGIMLFERDYFTGMRKRMLAWSGMPNL